MMNKNYNTITVNQDEFTIDDARIAAKQLFEVQVDDFYALKNEKWYKHLLSALTFGADKKKKVIRDIRTLSKLQTIFMRVYSENYKGMDLQLNELIENLSITNESVRKLYVNYVVGIRSQQSVLELSQLEQDILLLLLCSYTSSGVNEDKLKKYKSEIAHVIGRGLPQGEFKSEMLEQVNDGELFYRVILEMCAIDGGMDDLSMPDNIYEAINYLNISNKAKENVENQIRRELNSFGTEYLEKKYGAVEDDLLDDDIELVEEDTIDEIETTVVIDKEMRISEGNIKVYKNKEVRVHANIICEGELVFENCTIIYNDNALQACIKIMENGQLGINGSTIKCMSYKEEYLFECQGRVIIKNSKLVDCAYLFRVFSYKEFYISECEIMNCASCVVNISMNESSKASICNNMIRQSELKSFYCEGLSTSRRAMFEAVSWKSELNTNFQFNNNIIEELESFSALCRDESSKFIYIESNVMLITQSSFFNTTGIITAGGISECYFRGCKNVIETCGREWLGYKKIQIDNCIFEKCQDIITCGGNSKITNCQFVSCKNKLVNTDWDYDGGVIVENCIFKSITNDFEGDGMRMAVENSALWFKRGKRSDSKENEVCHCTFDGINMKKAFLIACEGYEKPRDGVVVTVSNCNFSHCQTERKSKKLIREFFSYYNALKKEKEIKATKIVKCTGIERFNSEGYLATDLSINYISTFGRKIGAESSITDRVDI